MKADVEATPRIVLAGSVGSSRRVLLGLLRNHANVVGVLGLSPELAPRVSGYTRMDDIASSAQIGFHAFRRINDPHVVDVVRKWSPDVFFVVGLSQLVGPELLSLARLGCVGFHPTRLPRGRGRAPIAWLVLDSCPGAATFFVLTEDPDSGPVLAQEPFQVFSEDYAADVLCRMEQAIDRALDNWLPQLISGKWDPVAQDDSLATFYAMRKPQDGLIHWDLPTTRIHSLVRAASHPHPGAYTYVAGSKLIVWRAEPETGFPIRGVPGRVVDLCRERGPLVQTGDGLLWLTEHEFEAGQAPDLRVGTDLGYDIEDEVHRLTQRLRAVEARLEAIEAEDDPSMEMRA